MSNRKTAKTTPSPVVFREKVLRNCLSAIRSKRSDVIRQFRQESVEARSMLLESFVSGIYKSTKMETDDRTFGLDELDLDSEEHRELMEQIAEAIAQELSSEQLDFELDLELEEMECYGYDEDSIICPLCRSAQMIFSECGYGCGSASCECGAVVLLRDIGMGVWGDPGQAQGQRQGQELGQGEGEGQGQGQGQDGGAGISAAEFKTRLGDVYDRWVHVHTPIYTYIYL
jgi:hypothetical protein